MLNKVNRGAWIRKMHPDEYRNVLKKQLESKIIKGESGCWIWSGTRQSNGYGTKKFYGHSTPVHRVSYFAYKGDIEPGAEVMHSCDVRLCINPDHLTLGTHQENMRDAKLRGRSGNGVMSGAYIPKRDSLGKFIKLESKNV